MLNNLLPELQHLVTMHHYKKPISMDKDSEMIHVVPAVGGVTLELSTDNGNVDEDRLKGWNIDPFIAVSFLT